MTQSELKTQIVPDCKVSGTCTDCHVHLSGNLCIVIVKIDGTRGIAIGIEDSKYFHPLAAIPFHRFTDA